MALCRSLVVLAAALSFGPIMAQTTSKPTPPPEPEGTSFKDVLAEVDLRLWGRVKMDVTYDNFQGRSNIDFMNYVTAEGPDEFNFNPRDSRFGFGAFEEWEDWKAKAVLEIDFYGDNAGNNLEPRLRHGYVQVEGGGGWRFVAGQTWNPLAQQNPGTIDFGIQSWSGNLWWRVPQVTVAKKFEDSFEVLLTAFKHRISSTQEQDERMPWIGGRVAWLDPLEAKGALLAVNVGVREVTVSGNDYSPWLFAVEGKLPIGDKLTLNGEFWTGQGIGREFVRYGLDYNNTTGEEIASTGGFLSAKYKATDALSLNGGIGIDDPDNEDAGTAAGVPFHRNMSIFANAKYQITKHLGTGVELIHFETSDVNDQDLDGQRFTMSVWFTF